MIKIKRNVKKSERRKLGIKRSSKAWKFSGLRNFVAKNSPLRNRHFAAKLFHNPKKSLRKRHFAVKWFRSPMPPSAKIFAAAKPPLGTQVPFRNLIPSFRSCEMAAKSPKRKNSHFATKAPFCREFCNCETALWHTSAIWKPRTLISQLRNELWNHLWVAKWAAKIFLRCEITSKLQNQSSNLQNG